MPGAAMGYGKMQKKTHTIIVTALTIAFLQYLLCLCLGVCGLRMCLECHRLF